MGKTKRAGRILSLALAVLMILNLTLYIAPVTSQAAPGADLSVDLSFEGGDSEAVNYDAPNGLARRATKFILTDDAQVGQVQVKITECSGVRDLIVAIYGSTSDNSKPDDRRQYGSPITVSNAEVKNAVQNQQGIVTVDFGGLELFAGHYWVVLDTSQSVVEDNTIKWARITDTGAGNNGIHYTAASGARPVDGKEGAWGSYTPHHYWLKVTATGSALTPTLEGYYTADGGSTATSFDVSVNSGTSEAAASAALPKEGYARLNSGIYYPVQFTWTINGSYDGSDNAVNTYTGTVKANGCPVALTDVTGKFTIEQNALLD